MGRIALGLLGLFFWATAAVAETRALLVGVSNYEVEGVSDLRGPLNDVRLLDKVLRGRGVTDIVAVADGLEGSAIPTRHAILAALDALEARTQDGDFVYIHLSGHGTRQTDQNRDESDGMDEVFLPADTQQAIAGQGIFPNAIVDDELGAVVQRLRRIGADVWLVMDSCYSGTGLRAAGDGTTARFVDPAVLGLSLPASPIPEQQIIEAAEDLDEGGGFLAFYAARSDEKAIELNLAPDGAEEAIYGLFSSKLAARLQSESAISFRQLFQGVLSDMKDQNTLGVARLQTPSWEGSLIDAALFGGATTIGVRRFEVAEDVIAAGKLHGLVEGTLVGLVADAADPADAVIGFAQTEGTSATYSYLRPVAQSCVPKSDVPCDYAGRLPAEATFAQVVARPVDSRTLLSHPKDMSGAPLGVDHPAAQMLTSAIAELNLSGSHLMALSAGDFTVDVVWDGQAFWFARQVVRGASLTGLRWAEEDGHLAVLMLRIARAEEMARMLEAVAATGSMMNANPVRVSATQTGVDAKHLAPIGRKVSQQRECDVAHTRQQRASPLELQTDADLQQCDILQFLGKGAVGKQSDVNQVYIDSQYCIEAVYSRVEGANEIQQLGSRKMLCSNCDEGYSAGDERLYVITTENIKNAEALNLEGLIENCAGANTRGAEASQAMTFLNNAAIGQGTRGTATGFRFSDIWVEQFNWSILPRPEAFLRAGRALDE